MDQLESIFNAAIACEGGVEREAYIRQVCGSDSKLEGRVRALVAAHGSAGAFLHEPASPGGREAFVAEGPGDVIGDYRLCEELGEGGFGVVYRAEQERPLQREVALKIIKLGMDTRQVIARFEAERQALALTDHENIARVYGAGATASGRPYFAMELVRGLPIHHFCDQERLPIKARLELICQVCKAIQHAHQKGLLHRDIKPNNILVTDTEGQPTPKVIDFGVAKATRGRLSGATLHTQVGQLLGTPAYMSPEQAAMTGVDVDTRTDVYSIGVLLYEVLTGVTPFSKERLRDAGISEVQRILNEEEPPNPSEAASSASKETAAARGQSAQGLATRLRGDLDWITLKAIEKDPSRRYSTPDALAADIQRHLTSKPVQAGPPNSLYVLGKFVRRNQVPVLAGTSVLLALLLGVALAAWGLIQVSGERDMARARLTFFEKLVEYSLLEVDAETFVDRASEAFGGDHGAVAMALTLTAQHLQDMGELSRAEDHLRRALELWNPDTGSANKAFAHAQLGSLLLDRTALDEAEHHLNEALALGGQLDPAPLTMLGEVHSARANLLRRRGDFSGSAAAYQLAISSMRSSAPDRHGNIGRTLQEQAQMYQAAGQDLLAAASRRKAVTELEQAYPDTVIAADPLLALGLSLLRIPGLAPIGEAEQYLRSGLEIYRQQPSLRGPRYLAGLTGLASHLAYGDHKQLAESEDCWAEALRLAESLFGESLEYAQVLERRATELRTTGRAKEALTLEIKAGRVTMAARGDNLTRQSSREFVERILAAAAWAVLPEDVVADQDLVPALLELTTGLGTPDSASLVRLQSQGDGAVGNLLSLSIVAAKFGQAQWAQSLYDQATPLLESSDVQANPSLASLLYKAREALAR